MKNILILTTLFSIWTGSASGAAPKRVAIVHSYDLGFYWTKQVEKGFLHRFGESTSYEIVFRAELDAKKNPSGLESRAHEIALNLEKTKFDILFVTDDDALDLVGRKYFNTTVKLVFAGINSTFEEFGRTDLEINKTIPENVSGVLERYEISPLIKLIKDLAPKSKNLLLLSDKSKTADGVFANISREIGNKRKFGKIQIKSVTRTNDFSVWKGVIRSAQPGDALIIFPYSNVDRSKALGLNTPDDFAEWIAKNSRAPEFATASLFKANNFFATVGINPVEHGEDAANAYFSSLDMATRNTRILTKNYARLKLNPSRANDLKIDIPFELIAYSHALTRGDLK